MLAKGRLALRPLRFALPGTCIPLVFRQQMRARCPVRDLIWMSVLLLCLEALALGIETAAAPLREYDPNSAGYLRRWLTMLALTAPALCLPLAAVLGALSAPAFSRFEETQSLLLTRLSAFDLCAGRLLAWLWPVISTLLASCALWLTIQVIWRPVPPGGAAGYFAIGMMHLVTLSAALATGAIGQLCALRRRPGRTVARGTTAALAVAGLALSGLFLANTTVRRMDDPTGLIDGLLFVNPAAAAASALRTDVLRLPWIYERTDAPEYRFSYPPPLGSCALFGAVGALAAALAAARMRRAYR